LDVVIGVEALGVSALHVSGTGTRAVTGALKTVQVECCVSITGA